MGVFKLVDKGVVPVDIKAEVIAALKKTLALAENGEVDTVVLIAAQPDGCWSYEFAGGRFTTEMVGRLEIIKAEWLLAYIEDAKRG